MNLQEVIDIFLRCDPTECVKECDVCKIHHEICGHLDAVERLAKEIKHD